MSLHPSIQVGSEVAVRDAVAPWAFLGRRLWSVYRVERLTPDRSGRYDVMTTTGQCWLASELHPLTDEILAAIAHESRLRGVWLRLMRLVNVSVEGPRWPERVTPEQARRVEELLTEIETLTGFRSQGGEP